MATIEDFQKSETLTLGVPDQEGRCVLVVPDKDLTQIGGKLY